MPAVSPSTIRQAVRDAVASADAALRESPWISDGPFRDPQSVIDGAFAVTVPVTEPVETRRFRADTGIRCRTTVRVRVMVTMRGDGAGSDYDAALDLEAAVCAAVSMMPADGFTAPALQRCERAPVGDDTAVLLTIEWTVDHLVSLPPMGD